MNINPYAPPKTESLVRKDQGRKEDEELDLPQPHQFVLGAMITVMSESTRPNNRVDASDICQMALQLAYELNAGKPIEALLELGISQSEDIGKAVYELEGMGYGSASEGDAPSDFDLLFDLTKPQHTWKVSWSTESFD